YPAGDVTEQLHYRATNAPLTQNVQESVCYRAPAPRQTNYFLFLPGGSQFPSKAAQVTSEMRVWFASGLHLLPAAASRIACSLVQLPSRRGAAKQMPRRICPIIRGS